MKHLIQFFLENLREIDCLSLFHELITSNSLPVDAQITAKIIVHLTNLSVVSLISGVQ